MILNPECQKRGREEISQVIGSERLPEFEDMDVLPYTTAIVHEVMRLVDLSGLVSIRQHQLTTHFCGDGIQ